jgi:hypothetical protein
LERDSWPDFVFAFHDGDEIGPHSGPDRTSHRPQTKDL